MTAVDLNVTMNPKAQGFRLKLKLELDLIPQHKERKLIVIASCI